MPAEGNGLCGILLLGGELELAPFTLTSDTSTLITGTVGLAAVGSSGREMEGTGGSSGAQIVGIGGGGALLLLLDGAEDRGDAFHFGTSSTLIFGILEGDSGRGRGEAGLLGDSYGLT